MLTLLLWICPFTWPIAILRMIKKRRQAETDRLIVAITGEKPAKRRGPIGWLLHKAWTSVHPPAAA